MQLSSRIKKENPQVPKDEEIQSYEYRETDFFCYQEVKLLADTKEVGQGLEKTDASWHLNLNYLLSKGSPNREININSTPGQLKALGSLV